MQVVRPGHGQGNKSLLQLRERNSLWRTAEVGMEIEVGEE